MALIVQKYGGTSVGTVERIQAVAQRVKQTVEGGHSVVVVVFGHGQNHRRSGQAGQRNHRSAQPPGNGYAAVHRGAGVHCPG